MHEKSSQNSKEQRSSRDNTVTQLGRRRATMNSRDSAYDEAEQLRRAIEESKREVSAAGAEAGGRKGKRSRSDSEQYVLHLHPSAVAVTKYSFESRRKEDTKRQRTISSSSPSDSKTLLANAVSDDEDHELRKARDGGQTKIRGAAARNSRNKELREQEGKKEQERAEAAGRRKARSERRRADGVYTVGTLSNYG